jgi:hypothetical protein
MADLPVRVYFLRMMNRLTAIQAELAGGQL